MTPLWRIVVCVLAAIAQIPASQLLAAERVRSLNDLTGPWQLFVDDGVVAAKDNVVRSYHPFEKDSRNPLIRADRPWEGNNVYLYGTVLPNETGAGYRMWYHALPETKGDDVYRLLYATSDDGLAWNKPDLGMVEYRGSRNNNIFIRRGSRDHIQSVIHTPWEKDPARRYLMINFDGDKGGGYMAAWSPDGLQWTDASDKAVFSKGGDVGQFLYDFHRREYVGYVKVGVPVSEMGRRAVGRIATPDPVTWPDPQLVLAPDTFDDRWAQGIQRTSFYGLSAFAYESMYLGFLWVFRADDESEGYFDGPIYCELVTSRDGVHWLREEGDRPAILAVGSDREWDRGMVFTATQPLVVDGKLRLYYGGVDGTHSPRKDQPWHSGIGLAVLRKDGFASLDSKGGVGTVTTRRLVEAQGPLRVNVVASGSLRVEVLDERGKAIPGYGRDECVPLTGDHTDAVVGWTSHRELPKGQPIRLRFILDRASLYSFAAGDTIKILDEAPKAPLGVLLTFEDGWGDSLPADGRQKTIRHGDMRIEDDKQNVAFGSRAARVGSKYAPLQTLEMQGTESLGTAFTLAVMARSSDGKPARLFSSYDDQGAYKSTEMVFDYDPQGGCMSGLRLIVKGIEVHSNPVTLTDGKCRHLAVTYDHGRIAFYVNGVSAGGGIVPGGEPVAMIRNLRIGEDAAHGHEQQFRGWMDDVLVYGRALSAAEIRTIATSGAEAFFAARGTE